MSFSILELPPEIREKIYREVLHSSNFKYFQSPQSDLPPYYKYDLSLLRVSRLVHTEAKKVFEDNVFIKITTPWPESIEYINNTGKVPIIAEGEHAAAFKQHHLHIYITTPDSLFVFRNDTFNMIISLEDLPAFTKVWRYSELNHQRQLNPHLSLELTIKDPYIPDRKLPKPLQESLLLPFSAIKGLHEFSVKGIHLLPSVEKRLTDLRAIEEPSVESCLASSLALKDQGNTALGAGKYKEAIEYYIQSFAAIHIEIQGRTRLIQCDGYFQQEIQSGQDQGKRADYVRLLLRVRLVANVIQAYLKLKDYAEAHFWGKRSIVIFRQDVTGDNSPDIDTGDGWIDRLAPLNFPAKNEMGKIFYRTALAARGMGKEADVRTLIHAAAVYLPHNEDVQREKKQLDEQMT